VFACRLRKITPQYLLAQSCVPESSAPKSLFALLERLPTIYNISIVVKLKISKDIHKRLFLREFARTYIGQ
jgi:hypothetical protein